jgi:hydrogenase maturation protease
MRVLVAGVGNMFLGDDGFGPAVAAALRTRTWPAGVAIADFGIRGVDLAFALTSGIDAAILIDAVARGGAPGTLYVIEPAAAAGPPELQPHALDPARVLALAASLGTPPAYVRVVGVEPACLDDDGDLAVGLSDPIARAIGPAVELVARLVGDLATAEASCTS